MTGWHAATTARGPQHSRATGLRSVGSARLYLLGLILYALLIAAYVGFRFGWGWLDGDAVLLSVASQSTYLEGTLAPDVGPYYLGYGYPTLNTFLAHLGGIHIEALQVYVQGFLLALLVPVSYSAFHALLGDAAAAALASLLLFLQPDFLFEGLRSSHAKFTWLLALGMLFVLARSLEAAGSGRTLARWATLFYLLAYGLIACNVFFASSYIFALGFAFLGGWALALWRRRGLSGEKHLRRLLYVTLACSILVFVFFFYIYPPAMGLTYFFQTAVDRVSGFLLDVETGVDPYRYVQGAWVSPGVYLVLSSLSWLVLGLSFANWAHKAWRLLRRQESMLPGQWLLWLVYTGFAFLLALGVFLDRAGALSANLQVRLFPHLMIVAIPLAAEVVTHIVGRAWRRGQGARAAAIALLAGAVLFFSVASIFKATNEPLLSNRWVFHSAAERAAVEWAGPRHATTWVWLGPDDRLKMLPRLYGDWPRAGLEVHVGREVEGRYDVLLSDLMDKHAARKNVLLPEVRGRLLVYDNGGAALYHPRPQTPYQR
jgi:hypothetical protein